MFTYDEFYAGLACSYCEDHEKAKKNASGFVQGILDQLYGKERYDEALIENYLEEIAHYFGLQFPKSILAIKPKNSMPQPMTDQILEKWKSFNNQYLKSLAQ